MVAHIVVLEPSDRTGRLFADILAYYSSHRPQLLSKRQSSPQDGLKRVHGSTVACLAVQDIATDGTSRSIREKKHIPDPIWTGSGHGPSTQGGVFPDSTWVEQGHGPCAAAQQAFAPELEVPDQLKIVASELTDASKGLLARVLEGNAQGESVAPPVLVVRIFVETPGFDEGLMAHKQECWLRWSWVAEIDLLIAYNGEREIIDDVT